MKIAKPEFKAETITSIFCSCIPMQYFAITCGKASLPLQQRICSIYYSLDFKRDTAQYTSVYAMFHQTPNSRKMQNRSYTHCFRNSKHSSIHMVISFLFCLQRRQNLMCTPLTYPQYMSQLYPDLSTVVFVRVDVFLVHETSRTL